jgi:hypothetical protein
MDFKNEFTHRSSTPEPSRRSASASPFAAAAVAIEASACCLLLQRLRGAAVAWQRDFSVKSDEQIS